MTYQVTLVASVRRGLKRIPRADLKRISAAIDELADEPRPSGSVKLAGEDDAWRIRVGDYRILYEIHDRRLIVLVVRVGHRKDVYRKGD